MGQIERRVAYSETLLASGVRVASGNSQATSVRMKDAMGCVSLVLDVTAGGTDNTDSLDVTVQTMLDGVNFVDVCHFTQVTGDAPVKRYVAKLQTGTPQSQINPVTAALAAGTTRNHFGDQWAVKWVVASGNNATFTFSVTACPC